jgi:hypothetical protein
VIERIGCCGAASLAASYARDIGRRATVKKQIDYYYFGSLLAIENT